MSTATKTRPSDAPNVTPSAGWAQIPRASKPSKAVSSDGTRPVIQHAFVKHTDAGPRLYATDSYVLVEIPITLDRQAKPDEVLPEIAIPPAALRALDASKGRFRLFDGLIEIEGRPDLYRPGSEKLTAPNFKDLISAFDTKEREPIGEVGFNPDLMKDVADALGARHGLRAEFISALRPILLTPIGGQGRALQMPIRLNV